MDQTKNNIRQTSSKDLLTCGGVKGIHEKLLLKSKSGPMQTQKVPRSNVLDRLQNFLPQLAQANETLKQQIEDAPAGYFDIENVDDAGKVIEMDVALVELEDLDSSETEDESSSSSSEEDGSEEDVVISEKLKLPGERKRKADIQELDGV